VGRSICRAKLLLLVVAVVAACKLKSHKRSVGRVSTVCKWTTLTSVGDHVIQDHRTGVCIRLDCILVVPSTRRSPRGDRCFPVDAARAWNGLPPTIITPLQGCSGAGTRWNAVPANILEPERRSGKYRWPQVER